jgi:P4 family phage/plasmid primase-like protien
MTIFYKTKKECLQKNVSNELVANYGIKKYFLIEDYESLLKEIKTAKSKQYFEYIRDTVPVKLFFDIEVFQEKNLELYMNYDTIIDLIKNVYGNDFILLESHKIDKSSEATGLKKSFHVIFPYIHFNNVKELKKEIIGKNEFKELVKEKIIDTSVYREGLFRTLYSSKEDEDRPLVYSFESPLKDMDLETFICNIDEIKLYSTNVVSSPSIVVQKTPDVVNENKNTIISLKDRKMIELFIKDAFNYNKNDITEIKLNVNNIIIGLRDKFCSKKKDYHESNHQYLIIDLDSSRKKCHDPDCNNERWNVKKFNEYSTELQNFLIKVFNVDPIEVESIKRANEDLKTYVSENFQDKRAEFNYDKSIQTFRSDADPKLEYLLFCKKCSKCTLEHVVENGNRYKMRCTTCHDTFPKDAVIIDPVKYAGSSKFWTQINLVQNNIINNYHTGEETFACDINLDNGLFNKEVTELLNQILDGHKISKLSQLMKVKNDTFVYGNEVWYYFNGTIWQIDHDTVELKKSILGMASIFNKIQQTYMAKSVTEQNNNLIHNIKSLITKINKPGFKKEIVEDCKLFFSEPKFVSKLDKKKHLVPFTNGAYDLLKNEFRVIDKSDFISLTVDYTYEPNVNNLEVHDFINKILPDPLVRNYVLKKMSECLNGDIPNTNFLMFIGDGANGKSQLLNLMKIAMGEFGEKVEVTLLTRKRNNANEANTEKIKLKNKRYAFLSEPEDSEKINISLLKELTGSEEIVARGLYEGSSTFVMETKLFLACNELPEIKGEDSALWRRIRVIDFPSRFVDDPKESNEFKIDRTLPSRMREDITWRQTFMNILLDYYYKDISEPAVVQVSTNRYRQGNDIVLEFVTENCRIDIGNKDYRIDAASLWEVFRKWTIQEESSVHFTNKQFKERIDKLTKYSFKKKIWYNNLSLQGWIGINLL